MARWHDLEADAPDFAARIRVIIEARKHKTLATLRTDGSPRVSGIEARIEDGELRIGMMPDSVKLADVRRDPRVALQALSDDPPATNPSEWLGDVKLSGVVRETSAPLATSPPAANFGFDILEAVLTRVGEPADHLVIESWHPGRGLESRERK
jgi:hypothetical protein